MGEVEVECVSPVQGGEDWRGEWVRREVRGVCAAVAVAAAVSSVMWINTYKNLISL